MGATERQQRAIARVLIQDGGTLKGWGTGFLVHADGLLLTAAHVLFDFRVLGNPRIAGDILLYFDTRGAAPPFVKAVELVQYDLKEDWALLRCAPPTGTEPIPLTAFPPARGTTWMTFGYPEGGDKTKGGGYDGTITTRYKSEIELDSSGANGLPVDALAQGISGAPCLVNDEVVGIIVARPGSKLIATCAANILRRQPDLCRTALPFESIFAAKLENLPRGELEDLAKRLGIDDADIAVPDLFKRVARSMLGCAPHELARLIRAKAEDSPMLYGHARRLFLLIETLWVRTEAVAFLAMVLGGSSHKVAAINTDELRAGHHYIARTSEAVKRFGEWEVCRFRPDVTHDTAETLFSAVRAEICNTLFGPGAAPNDAQLKRKMERKKPVIVIMQDPAVRLEHIAPLEARLPGLRVVLLTGSALDVELTAGHRHLAYVTPEIGPDERVSYEYATEECDEMRRALSLPPSEYA